MWLSQDVFCFKWGKAGWVFSPTLFGVYVDGMLETFMNLSVSTVVM